MDYSDVDFTSLQNINNSIRFLAGLNFNPIDCIDEMKINTILIGERKNKKRRKQKKLENILTFGNFLEFIDAVHNCREQGFLVIFCLICTRAFGVYQSSRKSRAMDRECLAFLPFQ